MFHPAGLGMTCVQPDQHCYCFKDYLEKTTERWGGACMGLPECCDAILNGNWSWSLHLWLFSITPERQSHSVFRDVLQGKSQVCKQCISTESFTTTVRKNLCRWCNWVSQGNTVLHVYVRVVFYVLCVSVFVIVSVFSFWSEICLCRKVVAARYMKSVLIW